MSSVNHPAHYNTGKIEVIDAIEDWGLNFALGNAVKYIARAAHKDKQLDDLEKAEWYIHHEILKLKFPGMTSKNAQAAEKVNRADAVLPIR